MESKINVVTHDGMFHADEVVAIAIVMLAFGRTNVVLGRTRDAKVMDDADLVIDVGGSFDGVKYFDHHQRGFNKTHEGTSIKYSSAGLIWDRYCPMIAAKLFDQPSINRINDFYNRVVNTLIIGIDAVDNGQYREPASAIHQNTLSNIVKVFNVNNYIAHPGEQTEAFNVALKFVQEYLDRLIRSIADSIMDEDIVRQCMMDAEDGVMVLPKFIPSWKAFLLKADPSKTVKVCLVEAKPDEWSITSALKESGSMEPLCPAPEILRGIKNGDTFMLGDAHIIFVHKTGYTGSFTIHGRDRAVQTAKLWIHNSSLDNVVAIGTTRSEQSVLKTEETEETK